MNANEIIMESVLCNRKALMTMRDDAAWLRRFFMDENLPFSRQNTLINAIEEELQGFGNLDSVGLVYI